jgi:hypothetical protein
MTEPTDNSTGRHVDVSVEQAAALCMLRIIEILQMMFANDQHTLPELDVDGRFLERQVHLDIFLEFNAVF